MGARGAARLSRLLLDTSVLVAVERGAVRPDAVVSAEDDLAVSAVSVAELLVGVELGQGARSERRRVAVERIIAELAIEPYDLAVARAHAPLIAHARQAGRPRSLHDLLIAATAVATERSVVTSDAPGFVDLPGVAVRVLA